MGAPWIDYIIADRVLIPPGDESNFSEKVVRLPDTYQPTDDKRTMPPASDRGQHDLAADAFVFCSFNQVFKITPEVFEVWMRLLKSVDGSILWLLHDAHATEPLRRHASDHGVDPQRLVFAPQMPNAQHLERIRHADLGLDCFPYGSHTTASDMLWAGVPLIALRGNTFASRVSSSILTAAELPELITTSLETHFQGALRLATHPAELAQVRERTRASRDSALFDTRRFTRNLETAYRSIWNRHASGLSPDHVDVVGGESPGNASADRVAGGSHPIPRGAGE
jgi:predicted O-linked N-acetylglucosamine transferase (SPINDLY family)